MKPKSNTAKSLEQRSFTYEATCCNNSVIVRETEQYKNLEDSVIEPLSFSR